MGMQPLFSKVPGRYPTAGIIHPGEQACDILTACRSWARLRHHQSITAPFPLGFNSVFHRTRDTEVVCHPRGLPRHSPAGPAVRQGSPLRMGFWEAKPEGTSFLTPYLMSPLTEAPVLQGEAFSYLVEPLGASVQLDCVVHGAPAPDIRWIKDGLPLRGTRPRHQLQNGSLTIRRTEARRDLGPEGGATQDTPQPFLMA